MFGGYKHSVSLRLALVAIATALLAAGCASSGGSSGQPQRLTSDQDLCVARLSAPVQAAVTGFAQSDAAGNAILGDAIRDLDSTGDSDLMEILTTAVSSGISGLYPGGLDEALATAGRAVGNGCAKRAATASTITDQRLRITAEATLPPGCVVPGRQEAPGALECGLAAWRSGSLADESLPMWPEARSQAASAPMPNPTAVFVCDSGVSDDSTDLGPGATTVTCVSDTDPGMRIAATGTSSLGFFVSAVSAG